jgi:hydrogenase maturation protease
VRDRVPDDVTVVEHEGEPTALLELWSERRLAVVIDAISGAGPPGAVRSFDATKAPLPSSFLGASTHAFTLAQVVELGRQLGRLPERLIVLGVEGRDFGAGAELDPAVVRGVDEAAARVLRLVSENY